MNTPRLPRLRISLLLLGGALLLASPASAKEKRRIPPPPPPQKVVSDIRGFIHRVANGVKDASKQTWSAIRSQFEETAPPRSPRPATRPKSGSQKTPGDSFARSKEAVPYRYDDAENFDARDPSETVRPTDDTLPQVNITSRDPAKAGTRDGARSADTGAKTPQQPAPLPEPSMAPSKTTVTPADANIEFARPVPGKRGLVYPPGVKESSENMVDVGDFETGRIVRDPRSGKLFRVP